MLPWRRRPQPDPDERLEAWETLQEARRLREAARRLKMQLRQERERNHLEELFRRAMGGKS